MPRPKFTRRDFFKTGTIGGGVLFLGSGITQKKQKNINYSSATLPKIRLNLPSKYALDLSPAKWIWYPSQRTLTNTFILFRKTIKIQKEIRSATGWILGDSRYELTINGKRQQWGPPPSDPRFSEADPMDLSNALTKGENIIGTTVLFYGNGDGTWPAGKPGFIFHLKIIYKDNSEQMIISDPTWKCHLARSWKPGQYKRWYLRALQEEFDARLYPYGWTSPNFKLGNSWLDASIQLGSPSKPALSTRISDYMFGSSSEDTITELRKRSIPLLKEANNTDISLGESYWVKWHRPPQEYFEMVVPNAYDTILENSAVEIGPQKWKVNLNQDNLGAVLTFSVKEQVVGWPFFRIHASEGTTIELMVQEGHQLVKDGGPTIINNHHHSWSRFICREGDNLFQTFDYESVKWIQLHIHGQKGDIIVENIGIRRRLYDWPNPPTIKTSDKDLQKLADASINTIYNNSQETVVDGMGRERQQYSGDIGHVLHALYRVFGEKQLPARYVNTFSQGMTLDGYFLDTWPAYDRLNRLAQRQLGLTKWGPLLDHGVGFNFDCYHHYLYTGSTEDLEEVWPRLKKFFYYLQSIVGEDGMLPVENIGIPAVWIDHEAYNQQRHKQCAFNLYASAMMKNAFSILANAMEEFQTATEAIKLSDSLLKNTIKTYWDTPNMVFICNKPWRKEEGKELLCDRSLATAILFDQCPGNQTETIIKTLIEKPKNLGLSYPPNANWYLWALGKAGRIDTVYSDFHERWITMSSVNLNNTMQEFWNSMPDSGSQWSHASIAPLLSIYMDIAGINPIKAGYKEFQIKPQIGELEFLELDNHTPFGPIHFSIKGAQGRRILKLKIPIGIQGELILDAREKIALNELKIVHEKKHFELNGGMDLELKLKY